MARVFVYGTLKKNYANNHLLDNSEFIGNGWTIESYRMFSVGFPVIRECEDGLPVHGEVYEVDDRTLKRLDALEAEGTMYNRKKVNVAIEGQGSLIEQDCSIYVGNERYWKGNAHAPYTHVNQSGELDWHPTR